MSIRQQAEFVPQKLVKDQFDGEPKDRLENLVREEVERQLKSILARLERLEMLTQDIAR